ncbi:MAG: thioredoxin family protein [Deltaproteobacteria bacterium]
MRIPALFSLLLALFVCGSPARAAITWRHGVIDPVLAEAVQAQRFVVIDFSAEWCGPCQTMDSLVWSRADVGAAVALGYVPLRVDADATEGGALMRRYGVGALPTVLAVRADGTEVDRLTGDNDSTTVLAALAAWRRGEGTLSVLAARVEQRPGDLAMRLDVGTRYADRGDTANATLHLQRVIAADPQNAQGYRSRALLALGDRLYLRALHDAARAVTPLQELVGSCPNTEPATQAAVPLATALHRTHRDDEARHVLDAHLASATDLTVATRAGSVAAMMLRERWDLPRAEQIARDAVVRAPRAHALIDALAEVVFAQGRGADAAQLEQRAIAADPGNANYRRQIARFQAAASSAQPSSPPQATSSPAPGATNPGHGSGRTVHHAQPPRPPATSTGTHP